MIKTSLLTVGFVLALAGAPAALAETVAATGETAAKDGADGESGSDKVICKRVSETGSHMRKTKVCRTSAEWDAEAESASEAIQKGREQTSQPGRITIGPAVGGT